MKAAVTRGFGRSLLRMCGPPLTRPIRMMRPLHGGKRLFVAMVLLAAASAAAGAQFQIVYNTPRGEDEKNARAFLEEEGVTRTTSDLLNEEFELRHELTLFLGGDRGPLYDEAADQVHMPYNFVFDIAERFHRDSYSNTGVDVYDVTRDAYLHALLHEISHALFVMYDLRTSGSLEKAVDALTILLLLRYYENGGDIVINAAELFVDEDGAASSSTTEPDFWRTHQLDQQSYDQALCLVYGSDPPRYADLRAGSEFLQIRDRECAREYRRQVNAWFQVLGSFLRRPPPE